LCFGADSSRYSSVITGQLRIIIPVDYTGALLAARRQTRKVAAEAQRLSRRCVVPTAAAAAAAGAGADRVKLMLARIGR